MPDPRAVRDALLRECLSAVVPANLAQATLAAASPVNVPQV